MGCKGLALKMDVTKKQEVSRGFQRVMRCLGRLDILLNSAGVGFRAPLEEMQMRDIKQTLDVNLLGVIACCRQATTIMKQQGQGCIINIASVAGTVGVPNMAVYAASKWAVRGLGLSLAAELRRDNIRVHNICPGMVDTAFFDKLAKGDPLRDHDPETMLSTDDVAKTVVYLATLSDRAKVDEITIRARRIWMNAVTTPTRNTDMMARAVSSSISVQPGEVLAGRALIVPMERQWLLIEPQFVNDLAAGPECLGILNDHPRHSVVVSRIAGIIHRIDQGSPTKPVRETGAGG